MRYYYREKDWIYIGFDYRPYLATKMKKDFGAKYNPATKEWYLQLGLEKSLLLKGFLEENGFEKGRVIQSREIELKPIENAVDEELVEEMIECLNLPLNLRDYQLEGLTYMINHANCINGCSMGLGKTRQTIAFVELLDLFPCIIVCPSTVKTSWEREWKRCNPKRTLHILDSKSSKNVDWEVDVTVINYDFLFEKNSDGDKKDVKIRYGEELLKDWEALILDEVHLCKNPKAMRSKAVEKIAKQSNKIVALSGAVIMNRPQEIISVLKIIGKFDKIFPDLKYFLYRYCNAKMTPFGLNVTGASYTLELNEILRHYCYFRKERREVLKELPPIIEQTIDCSITNKKEYKMAEENFIEYLEGIDIEAAEKAKNAEHLVRLTNLKRLSVKGKTKFIIQFLKDWRESDEELKLIVFGMMKEPLKELYKEFSKYSELVVGGGSTEEKMNKVENWKRDKQFLFANMETLSTGIDGLQDCCYNIVFIELPQTPTELEQATARIDRMGQVHNMNAYYLMSQETIDVETREILDYKIKITDAVNKGIDTIINSDESTDTLLIKKIKDKSRNKK